MTKYEELTDEAYSRGLKVKEKHLHADLIRQGLSEQQRLQKLRSVAYYQLHSLESSHIANRLKQNIQKRIEQD